MTNSTLVFVNFIVISTLPKFVSKKVNLIEIFFGKVSETIASVDIKVKLKKVIFIVLIVLSTNIFSNGWMS